MAASKSSFWSTQLKVSSTIKVGNEPPLQPNFPNCAEDAVVDTELVTEEVPVCDSDVVPVDDCDTESVEDSVVVADVVTEELAVAEGLELTELEGVLLRVADAELEAVVVTVEELVEDAVEDAVEDTDRELVLLALEVAVWLTEDICVIESDDETVEDPL